MQQPTLEDYQLSESLVQAAELSKDQADRVRDKIAGLLWIVVIIGVGAYIYSIESDVFIAVFLGFLVGGLGGGFLMPFVVLSMEIIWGLTHSGYRQALKRIADYKAADKAYKHWEKRTSETFWTNLDGLVFEQELGKVFAAIGYDVEITPGSGDGGIDLLLTKDGETNIVQCKRWKRPAGVATVRELYGVLVASGNDYATLACTAGFTRGVYDFVRDKPIILLDLNGIVQLNTGERELAWVAPG